MRKLPIMVWILVLLAGAVTACDDDTKTDDAYPYACDEPWCRPEAGAGQPARAVDVVFVIENTLDTRSEIEDLRSYIAMFLQRLRAANDGLPDLHFGVVTTDLGTAPYNVPGCQREGGDSGRFLKGVNNSCTNPVGQNYVVDVAPRGCTISRGAGGACASHDCTETHCGAAAFVGADGAPREPIGLTLAIDEQGCPRCRNYRGQTLDQVLHCILDVGDSGCGQEQSLEAMRQALVVVPEGNERFLRPAAALQVTLLNDGEDCSASDPVLFSLEEDDLAALGQLTSFRCTEFGVVCDEPWVRPMEVGELTYTNCRPREAGDPGALLHPVSGYVDDLRALKPSGLLLATAIGGPFDGTITVYRWDEENEVQWSKPVCQYARPSVRLTSLVRALARDAADADLAFASICGDLSAPLTAWGDQLTSFTTARCTGLPLAGCPDPAFAFGAARLTALPYRFAAVCAPTCAVFETTGAGDPIELPPCPRDHASGHPAEVDPALPVPACFHVTYDPGCALPCSLDDPAPCHPVANPWWGPSRGAAIAISRRAAPTEAPTITFTCEGLPLFETGCADGLDEDMDGRVDAADPDCR